jgi:hypothetical protein
LIDSGREWIVPDALARGELLYRDVVYWFGPFTPYFQAAFLRIFGSGFPALVAAGAAAGLAALGVLRWALGKVTGSTEAWLWTVLAIPVLVFMPEAGGPLLGMGYRIWHAAIFALAAVAAVPAARGSLGRAALVGALCGGAGLCRTEWGLAAVGACFVAILVEGRLRRDAAAACAAVAATFLAVFGGVLLVFVRLAGFKNVIEDGHVLLTGLAPETRTFLYRFSGIGDWRPGLAEGLYVASSWVGAFLVVVIVASWRVRPRTVHRGAAALAACLLLMLATGVAGSWGAKPYSGAPWICLAAAVYAVLRRRDSSGAVLAACGVAGLLLSYRRPFHIGDSGYVGPPLLFAIVCAAGLTDAALRSLPGGGPASERARRLWHVAIAALAAGVFVLRIQAYREDERRPVAGTGGMLAARPELAARLERIAGLVRERTGPGDGLVAIPEGEILNALSGRPNPVRYKLFLPGYLSAENEEDVIREFDRVRPATVVVLYRPTSEYGPGLFGEDYGRRLDAYLEEKYAFENVVDADRVRSRVGSWARLGTRRSEPAPGEPSP